MRTSRAVALVLTCLLMVSCESRSVGDDSEKALRDLAIRFLTATSREEHNSCLDANVNDMGRLTQEQWARMEGKLGPLPRENIRIREIEVDGDAAVVWLDLSGSPRKVLLAARKDGAWRLTSLPVADMHWAAFKKLRNEIAERNPATSKAAAAIRLRASRKSQGVEEDTDAALRDLAIRYLSAKTYEEWIGCLHSSSPGRHTREQWTKAQGTQGGSARKDVRILRIERDGDGAVIWLEGDSENPEVLLAVRRGGSWSLTRMPAVGLHKRALKTIAEGAKGSSRIRSNEAAAVRTLWSIVSAQKTFIRVAFYGEEAGLVYANPRDGLGFYNLYQLDAKRGGKKLSIIAKRLARATTAEHPLSGYYFVDITGNEDGPYNYAKQFGVCAVPAEYGTSGVPTFVVDAQGAVYKKDTGGEPVTTWPNLAEGWVLVK